MKGRMPEVVESNPIFEAHEDHIVAILPLPGGSTAGIRFTSPKALMDFFTQLMMKAAEVWPDDPIIREFTTDD